MDLGKIRVTYFSKQEMVTVDKPRQKSTWRINLFNKQTIEKVNTHVE